MLTKTSGLLGTENYQKVTAYLLAGDFTSVEALVFTVSAGHGAAVLEEVMNEVTASPAGHQLITSSKLPITTAPYAARK